MARARYDFPLPGNPVRTTSDGRSTGDGGGASGSEAVGVAVADGGLAGEALVAVFMVEGDADETGPGMDGHDAGEFGDQDFDGLKRRRSSSMRRSARPSAPVCMTAACAISRDVLIDVVEHALFCAGYSPVRAIERASPDSKASTGRMPRTEAAQPTIQGTRPL